MQKLIFRLCVICDKLSKYLIDFLLKMCPKIRVQSGWGGSKKLPPPISSKLRPFFIFAKNSPNFFLKTPIFLFIYKHENWKEVTLLGRNPCWPEWRKLVNLSSMAALRSFLIYGCLEKSFLYGCSESNSSKKCVSPQQMKMLAMKTIISKITLLRNQTFSLWRSHVVRKLLSFYSLVCPQIQFYSLQSSKKSAFLEVFNFSWLCFHHRAGTGVTSYYN